MKSVTKHSKFYSFLISSLFFFIFSSVSLNAQEANIDNGKKLFQTKCAACHKLEGALLGPELYKIGDKREKEWLSAWIKDNVALTATGDALAKEVSDSTPIVMTPFKELSDQDIEDMIAYFDVGEVSEDAGIPIASVESSSLFKNPGLGIFNVFLTTIILFVLLSLIIALSLNAKFKDSIIMSLISNPLTRFLVLIFVVLGSTWLFFSWLMQIDVNVGYQPVQPIAFSHSVHAGDNSIDCQYCHSSAKNSKTSGIPSTNVCMNCHKLISEYNGDLFGDYSKEDLDNEIQKIYDAVGWDKENSKYIENYEQVPVEWVRIHNLADFAYYNHSQHVTVGGIECQTCHGPVEEMHEVSQFSPLTMDWCITCHRDSKVDLTNNEYYKNIHKKLLDKNGEQFVENVTEAQMGGLECGKCHY